MDELTSPGARTMLVDCDVHQELHDNVADLYPYLSEGWKAFVKSPAANPLAATVEADQTLDVAAPGRPYTANPFGALQKDATPPNGRTAGSDPSFMATSFLDRYDVTAAILTGGQIAFGASALSNPYFAREVARAFNDLTLDVWPASDDRYYVSAVVAAQVPAWAADEIHRLAEHPKVVQVLLMANPHGAAFGHPVYADIHRACAETGLPLAIHAFGDGIGGAVPSPMASGYPSLYAEYHSSAVQGLMTHLTSFVLHGVFDRYPDFKLVLIEGGVSWLPSYLRRFEADYKGLRREAPWCKRLPGEYAIDNVRYTTQPFDIEDPSDPMLLALEAIGAQEAILYSSDYPHWDIDVPDRIRRALPSNWRDKVLYGNAAALYGLASGAS